MYETRTYIRLQFCVSALWCQDSNLAEPSNIPIHSKALMAQSVSCSVSITSI